MNSFALKMNLLHLLFTKQLKYVFVFQLMNPFIIPLGEIK